MGRHFWSRATTVYDSMMIHLSGDSCEKLKEARLSVYRQKSRATRYDTPTMVLLLDLPHVWEVLVLGSYFSEDKLRNGATIVAHSLYCTITTRLFISTIPNFLHEHEIQSIITYSIPNQTLNHHSIHVSSNVQAFTRDTYHPFQIPNMSSE